MPQYNLDFSQVEEFEPLPAGEYPVTVDHVEVKIGKESGQPYLNWDLIVSDGDFTGRHLFMASGLGDKSLWRLKAIFDGLGVLEEQMSLEVDDDSGYVISPELAGLPAVAVVRQEVYQNRTQNRVDDLLGSGAYEEEIAPPPPPAAKPRVNTPPAAAPRVTTPPTRQPATTRPKLNLK